MVSAPCHHHSRGPWELGGGGWCFRAAAHPQPQPEPGPFPCRRSLQQVLLLCTGIVVMVLFSLFVE